jgi:uncharacterized damage-inducible protein DinB
MYVTIKELYEFTDRERERWDRWFQGNGEELLEMPVAGEHHPTVGRLILHTFGAEMVFVESLRGDRRTDYRALPATSIEAVFGFGLKARQASREYVASLGADDWNRPVVFDFADSRIKATVRKALFHTQLHEIRHWAQMARIMRERGLQPPNSHDLLFKNFSG